MFNQNLIKVKFTGDALKFLIKFLLHDIRNLTTENSVFCAVPEHFVVYFCGNLIDERPTIIQKELSFFVSSPRVKPD